MTKTGAEYNDDGGASRFFPCFHYGTKAGRKEREVGCENLPARSGAQAVEREEGSDGMNSPRAGAGRTASEVRNHHPTVKSVSVMRWLVKLVTPPNGVVLDPFAGSGTTGVACAHEGFEFVGFEQSAEYAAIAEARITHAQRNK
jgi:site-specific DNA-methyltransferase (adenine-specific)